MPDRLAGNAVETAPRRRAGPVPAGQLRPRTTLAPFGVPWSHWQLGWPVAGLLVGPPGSGKSTLLAALAVSAARRVPVLLAAIEEGHSAGVQDRLARAGLDDLTGARLAVTDCRSPQELAADLDGSDAQLVLIDSLSALGATTEWLATMMAGRSWFGSAHTNRLGRAAFGREWEHAVDVVIDVADGVARPRKNRFGPMTDIAIWEDNDDHKSEDVPALPSARPANSLG